jgi:hypothetical protein
MLLLPLLSLPLLLPLLLLLPLQSLRMTQFPQLLYPLPRPQLPVPQ